MDDTQTETTQWLEKLDRGLHPREVPQLRAWLGSPARRASILAAARHSHGPEVMAVLSGLIPAPTEPGRAPPGRSLSNRTLAILAAAGIVIAVTFILQSVFDPERLAARYLLGVPPPVANADPGDDSGLLMLSNDLTIPSDRIGAGVSPCRGAQCAGVGIGVREPAECQWREEADGRVAHCLPDI